MANGGVITNQGLVQALKTLYEDSSTDGVTAFSVGTGTTTPVATDTSLETRVQIGGANQKDFVSGYPTYNSTSKKATARGFLSATECNGNNLTEVAQTDSSATIFDRHVFTSISKSSTDEIAFIFETTAEEG